jgi:hypothetical protein
LIVFLSSNCAFGSACNGVPRSLLLGHYERDDEIPLKPLH